MQITCLALLCKKILPTSSQSGAVTMTRSRVVLIDAFYTYFYISFALIKVASPVTVSKTRNLTSSMSITSELPGSFLMLWQAMLRIRGFLDSISAKLSGVATIDRNVTFRPESRRADFTALTSSLKEIGPSCS